LTGGGTGGHIYPLIAVTNELKKQAEALGIVLDLRYFGAEREYAQQIVDSGMEFIPIFSSKFRRYWSLFNLIDILKFFISIPQILWKMFWFMPEVIFSKGGPGALAVILIGRFYRVPVVIHESDSVPGFTNKFSSKLADKIFLAFASAQDYLKNKNIEVIGNPVRESLFQQAESLKLLDGNEQAQARKGFGLNPNEQTVLILGGSQGSERMNNFVLENLELLISEFQILHQVGVRNYEEYQKEFEFKTKDWSEAEKNLYHFQAFFDKDMADALIAADLVISRAGSGLIFELSAFGKPAILVPLEESANGHQKKNAYTYSQIGAATVIEEKNLLANLVLEELKKITASPDLLQKMSQAAQSFYRPNSALIIARYLLTYV